MQRNLKKDKKEEQINFKVLKKKVKKSRNNSTFKKVTKKINTWF